MFAAPLRIAKRGLGSEKKAQAGMSGMGCHTSAVAEDSVRQQELFLLVTIYPLDGFIPRRFISARTLSFDFSTAFSASI